MGSSDCYMLCESRGWFLSRDHPSDEATHYTMDGHDGGMIKVPDAFIEEFNRALFVDIERDVPVFIIERRRQDIAAVVIDIDFAELPVDKTSALMFAEDVICHVFNLCEFVELLSIHGHPKPDLAIVSTCKASANMHITFPFIGLSQRDCATLICVLARVLCDEHKLKKDMAPLKSLGSIVSLEVFEKILDVSVAIANGVRMNGCRKKSKCTTCKDQQSSCDQCDHGMKVSSTTKVYNCTHQILNGDKKLKPISMKMDTYHKWTLSHLNNERATQAKLRSPVGVYMICMQTPSIVHAINAIDLLHGKKCHQKHSAEKFLGTKNIQLIRNECTQSLGYPGAPKLRNVTVPSDTSDPTPLISITFDVNDPFSRYCANIGGSYRNAQSFLVLDVNRSLISQKCFCQCPASEGKIKCSSFSSQTVKLCEGFDLNKIKQSINAQRQEQAVKCRIVHSKSSKVQITEVENNQRVIRVNVKAREKTKPPNVVRSPNTRRLQHFKITRKTGEHIKALSLKAHVLGTSISFRIHVPHAHPEYNPNQISHPEVMSVGVKRLTDGVLPERSLIASSDATEVFDDEVENIANYDDRDDELVDELNRYCE